MSVLFDKNVAVEREQAAVPVLTVSAVSLLIKETLEGTFHHLWVSGEISNLRQPRSGHNKPRSAQKAISYQYMTKLTPNSPVKDIIEKYAHLADEPNVWIAPNIPSDVLERALKRNKLNKISNNDVLLVVGDWMKGLLWGKNDNFLLLTKNGIIGCAPYIECSINYSEITKACVIDNGDCLLFGVNDDEKVGFGFSNMSRNFCDLFCEFLNEAGEAARPPSPK